MRRPLGLLLFCVYAILNQSFADERIELQETTVIGNRELPKITHIVPWQAAQFPAPELAPFDQLLDEALMPIDRDEFRLRVRYYYERNPADQSSGDRSEATAKK